ncbi:CoA-transferase subunit beta [Chloroflexota bacterium]
MTYAKEYTAAELMAVQAAKLIKDEDLAFVGIGVPLIAGLLAKLTHAPNATLIFETGLMGSEPLRMILFIDDNGCHDGAFCVTTLWRVFSDLQRGYYDLGLLGAAQLDRYGNINSTLIGDYLHPQVRLPGSGGGNDIGSSVGRLVIMTKLEETRFVPQLDYMTTPGYLQGWDTRAKAGLTGGGPIAVITDKCNFKFEPDSREMVLDSLHPNMTLEKVKREVSWEIKLPPQVKITEPPTEEQIELIRTLDPAGFVLRETLSAIDFEDWANSVECMTETLRTLYRR